MTEISSSRETTGYSEVDTSHEPTAWVGWVLFAGTMLLVVGAFQAMAGFVALFKDDYYVVTSSQLVVSVDYTGWGWVQIGLGLLAVAAGFGVLAGKMWARIYAIIYAGLAAVVNMAFLSAYPVWMTIMIAVDVLVIFALAVHGKEVKY